MQINVIKFQHGFFCYKEKGEHRRDINEKKEGRETGYSSNSKELRPPPLKI